MQNKITNTWICQVENKSIKPLFGDLIINDGKIEQIIPRNHTHFVKSADEDNKGPSVLDAGGRVTTLPNVNFHEHFYSRLAKGLNITGSMDSFVHILENLWWKLDTKLDEPMVRASVQMGALESIRNGVSYTFDHHASPNFTKGSLNVIGAVLADFNMRGVLCFETSDRNGDARAQQALEENSNFYLDHTSDDLKAMMGLHAAFTVSDKMLEKAAHISQQNDLGIHIHLCEGLADRQLSFSHYGAMPAQRLNKYDLLNDKSILAHGIYLHEQDRDLIAEKGSAIAYNPDSNMNNGVGLPEFDTIPEAVPIIVGTDGMHANPIKSMKQLFLLKRHHGISFDTVFSWFQKIYFDQLNFVKKYFPDFPSLQVNDRADFVIWDYVPPTPISEQNFWGHYIYGITERPVHSVVQKGGFLMKNFDLININEDRINKEIIKQGTRLFDAF
jgi:cytosine/adenosine deaminase-related metal-dependent hydrolase